MAEQVPKDSSMFIGLTPEQRLKSLTDAVYDLYYSACWKSDRFPPDIEALMWERVRNAAGFPPGNSPKSLFTEKE